MRKIYKLEDLGCANCASKMEREISKLQGINSASVNFITQKLTLEAEEELSEETVNTIQKIIKKIEPYCKLRV